jgi:hypothetical protein
VEEAVKQTVRLITQPKTFFSQLQWSTHHWFIMLTFLALALVETQTGAHVALYQRYAAVLSANFGLSLEASTWLIALAKLGIMLWGAASLASILYIVGSLFGRETSRRVFSRRIAVVFTVFLAGYTAQHGITQFPWLLAVTIGLYAWGLLLGYLALREQFELTHLETGVLGTFAILLVTLSWHITDHVIEAASRMPFMEVAKQAAPVDNHRPLIPPIRPQ